MKPKQPAVGVQRTANSFICISKGGGLGEEKSNSEELRPGQAAGTSTSDPAEEALAVPAASCLCWEATGI